MNGLTAANVDHLTEAINRSIDRYKASGKKETAGALGDLVYAIDEMRRYNATQPSRPDRVGDECWYELVSYGYVNDKVVRVPMWKQGVLRCWYYSNENCIAMVEDSESHDIIATGNLSFSTEAPA